MRSPRMISQLALVVALANAEHFFVDHLTDKTLDPALKVSPAGGADLDNTTLGGPTFGIPKLGSSESAFRFRTVTPQDRRGPQSFRFFQRSPQEQPGGVQRQNNFGLTDNVVSLYNFVERKKSTIRDVAQTVAAQAAMLAGMGMMAGAAGAAVSDVRHIPVGDLEAAKDALMTAEMQEAARTAAVNSVRSLGAMELPEVATFSAAAAAGAFAALDGRLKTYQRPTKNHGSKVSATERKNPLQAETAQEIPQMQQSMQEQEWSSRQQLTKTGQQKAETEQKLPQPRAPPTQTPGLFAHTSSCVVPAIVLIGLCAGSGITFFVVHAQRKTSKEPLVADYI
eukprot:gnl/MRDRNA2_/MRDRNA2_126939_c0_seq1.p1 gnl/MRDRNA2_/MRDRNA2_126939_c0~~gnl/MRDRNA2_/MRDRNA2_126939_c0_seq1.p1  ORF type:complete len:338 (+),score=79.22 gnl/MRDRNA2_/MRDRNA2_126939_c0_seq1:49-1062(+)